jgi:hypothetical protein
MHSTRVLWTNPGLGNIELSYPSLLNYGESLIIHSVCLTCIGTRLEILQVRQLSA